MSAISSCLRCANYSVCKDQRKSIIFTCDRFKVTKESLTREKEILESHFGSPFSTSTLDKTGLVLSSTAPPVNDVGGVDAYELIKSVLKDKRIVSPDLKIPEGDFAEAPNFYTWCVSDKFLHQKPYVSQALIGTQLFSEWCPDCTDMLWMQANWKVDDRLGKFEKKVALLEYGKCPYCAKTKLDHFKSGKLNPYYELALSAGQRGGKSALVGMLTTYLTHRVLKLERPTEVYGVLNATVLQGTFVALTYAQAKDTLWEPYYGNILDSKWFQDYHAMLDTVQHKHGEEVYKLKDTFVQYRHRNFMCYPAGPDKRVLRGRTRAFCSIDELGWFPNDISSMKNIKMNATEVYIALERSLLTLRASAKDVIKRGFYNVPFGYFINISSPSSVRDKIMELVSKSQGSKRILGMCMPTWRMNPRVPRSALSEEFKKDPVAAMRDYGAQPPLTNSPFIAMVDKVAQCLSKNKNSLQLRYKYVRSADKLTSELYAELVSVKQSGKPSVLALDAGLSNNSFSFAIGHLTPSGYPVITVVGEVMPEPGVRINFSLMYSELLAKLVPTRNVVLCAADRWNSAKVLSDMEQEFGVVKRQYSLKYSDMQLFKSYLDDMQTQIPCPTKSIDEILKYDHSQYPQCFKHLPADHLVLQLLTVQDTGSQVLKGDALTDDIARAAFLCHRMLIDEANAELLTQSDAVQAPQTDATQMAVSRHYSGGGVRSNSGGGNAAGSSLGMLRQRA